MCPEDIYLGKKIYMLPTIGLGASCKVDDGDHPYHLYHKAPPNQQSTTVGGPTKGLGAADKWMKDTTLG